MANAGQQPVAAALLAIGADGVKSVRVARGHVSVASGPLAGTFASIPRRPPGWLPEAGGRPRTFAGG
jgi:hypothetical protein